MRRYLQEKRLAFCTGCTHRKLRFGLIILFAAVCQSVCLAQSDQSNTLFAQGVELYNKGEYADAITLFEQVTALDNQELGETSARRGYGEAWLAACYYKTGDTVKANELQPFAYKVTPIDRRLTVESDRLSDQGVFFYTAGNYEKALEYFQRCAALELKNIGRCSFYANSIRMCADCLMNMGRADEAKPLLLNALGIYEKEGCDYGCLMTEGMLGLCYRYEGQADSACHYLERAQQGYRLIGDEQSVSDIDLPLKTCRAIVAYMDGKPEAKTLFSDVKTSMEAIGITSGYEYDQVLYYLLGCSYFFDSDWKYVYNTGKELRRRYESDQLTLTGEYIDIIHLTVLAGGYSQLMPVEEAITHEEFILRLVKENQGTDNEYYVRSLQYLASLNSYKDTELAQRQAQEAYEIVERSNQQLTPQTAALVYQGMAQMYSNNMKLDEAAEMFDKAYNVYLNYNIPVTGDYTILLSNIVSLYSNIDRLDDASAAGEQVIKIYKTNNWPVDNTYVTTLVSLLNVYDALGNTKRLRELIADTRQAYQDAPALPRADYNYTRFLQAEANRAVIDGNFTQAITNVKEMLALADSGSNTDGDFKEMLKTNGTFLLVQCYNAQGKRELAWETLRQMNEVSLTGNSGKPEQYAYTMSLALNSIQKMANGDYNSAIADIRQSIQLYDKLNMGENNPMRLNLLNCLTTYAWQAGDMPTLMQAVSEQNSFLRSFVRSHFQTLTYQERCNFWAKYNEWFNVQLPNAVYHIPTDTMRCEAYNGLLLSKGLLLNSEIELKRLIDNSNDHQAQQLYSQFIQHKTQLAKLQTESLSSEQCDSLSEVIYLEEKEVMLMLNEKFGDYTKRLNVTWNDVCRHLKTGEAAIEFIVSPLTTDSLVYSALILKPGYDAPHLVPLFTENQLKGISADQLYKSTAAGQLIWKPMSEELSGVHRIFFSPAGMLYSTGIENLVMSNGTHTAGEQYELLRVSSTREVALTRHATEKPCITLFGGIEYDADVDAIAQQNKALASTGNGYRPRSATDRIAMQDGVSPLPGTRQEVEQINTLLQKNGVQTMHYMDEQASEESFKAQEHTHPTWLHIATHGFFWNEEQVHEYQDLAFMQQSLIEMMGEQSTVGQEDRSLTRTGLLFAGANNTLQGDDIPASMDDGILTAQEISRIDLRTVDLVVLSACETATGEINSEGVFGLQRGFKKAGTNSIMMSLWKVDDDATCLLMTEFYNNWISKKMTKQKALKEAKQTVRSHKEKGWDDPKYWAAFILLDAID